MRRLIVPCLGLFLNSPALPPDLVLDDSYSLRRGGLDALLLDHHLRTIDRQTTWVGAWPAPSLPQQVARPDTQSLLRHVDTAQQRSVVLHPLLGVSYRSGLVGPTSTSRKSTDLDALVSEGGGVLRAEASDFHAWGDARIYVERQEPFPHSYDGQFIEPSKQGDESIATFTSFARFEGRMTIDTKLGRFGAGRHRQHLGPAYQYPLVLGQWTEPYSHVDWSWEWGDFRLRTLWAQLATDGAGRFRKSTDSRSLYVHRYEYSPSSWLDLGCTEALILFKVEEPIAFVPVVPLFMMKGQSVESNANGELAFDINVRPVDGWRLYGEFLIDDMSEPASLFNDFWKNKWALTLGSQVAFTPLPEWEAGVIAEMSRVEPWTYTEYLGNTNQASHQGVLLGNPNGPNSFSLAGLGYVAYRDLSFSSGLEWVRKGTDLGSDDTDTLLITSRARKTFLDSYEDLMLLKTTLSGTVIGHVGAWLETSWPLLGDLPASARHPARFSAGLQAWL